MLFGGHDGDSLADDVRLFDPVNSKWCLPDEVVAAARLRNYYFSSLPLKAIPSVPSMLYRASLQQQTHDNKYTQ